MFNMQSRTFFIFGISLALSRIVESSFIGTNVRAAELGRGVRFSSPLLQDEIDLENIDGIHQLTKLVLLKTDSLPGEVDEKIDGRYLNSLMETLYTGLRKPFKSVSADILGIFPSFEEVQVKCEKPGARGISEKQRLVDLQRRSLEQSRLEAGDLKASFDDNRYGNETYLSESDVSYSYKSPTQVCKVVTGDCLSMDDLVQILPPSVITFDQALVRLCPIMLFRIMNNLCRKPSDSLYARQDTESISSERFQEEVDTMVGNNSINLSTLQILKNLQNSDELSTNKRPMKLHKKLKTQTNYKNNRRMHSGSLTQQGVDEQLLKIRLKLNEPSIEKVWIFSLLFVILSIVVSMGGLIVLPFVRKTTRRRILTLFEGLAVGGLSGSATLHMFPQAFGLVDENYHRYFWRIFGVFFGIYLCYLCERTIKILRVVRTRMRRRSRASLIDMGYRYGFPTISRSVGKDESTSNRLLSQNFDLDILNPRQDDSKKRSSGKRKGGDGKLGGSFDEKQKQSSKNKHERLEAFTGSKPRESGKRRKSPKRIKRRPSQERWSFEHNGDNFNNGASAVESPELDNDQSIVATRQRLIKCLQSVQSQFSPVYAVYSQASEVGPRESEKLGRMTKDQQFPMVEDYWSGQAQGNQRKNRLFENSSFFSKAQDGVGSSTKRHLRQKEMETILYHRNLMEQQDRRAANIERGYLQQRLSSVKDVAGGRQDQDNAARMSVDTVAWMIVFGDAVLNVIDGLSIGAAFERNILAGISIAVAVMLEEVTHRLGTFAVLIRAGMSMQQSLLCTFLSACALFPGLVVGILLSDATEDATPYIFCAAGGIFLYMVSRLEACRAK